MGASAREKYQTMTVGYRFEEMRAAVLDAVADGADGAGAGAEEANEELRLPKVTEATKLRAWKEYDAFISRIYSSTPAVRMFMLDALASSLLNENRQVCPVIEKFTMNFAANDK